MIERLPHPDQRRLFFRRLARETGVRFAKPHMQFPDLPKLPPEAIAALIARVRPGVASIPEEGQVSARLPGAGEIVVLFPNGEGNPQVRLPANLAPPQAGVD